MCPIVGIVIVSALNAVANWSEPLWDELQIHKCVQRLGHVHGDSLAVNYNSILRPLLSWTKKSS